MSEPPPGDRDWLRMVSSGSREEPSRVEPSADHRMIAQVAYQFFAAFKNEGFTEAQALDLTRGILVSMVQNGMDG